MRSLFLKIFFSFWLTIVLMGVPFYLIGLMNRPEHPHPLHDFSMQAMAKYGEEAIDAWRNNGREGLLAYVARVEQQSGISIYLFSGGDALLSGDQPPAEVAVTAQRVLRGEEWDRPPIPRGKYKWLGRRLDTGAEIAGQPLIIVLRIQEPTRPFMPFSPHNPWGNIFLFFVVGGMVSYFLSRSLTTPIRKLREAAKRLARGDFTVRIAKDLGDKKGDEVVDLGKDFDSMAERIEGLLHSQKQLLRDISHELRSPLARLLVALEIARQRDDKETALARIEKEAERLNQLISQLIILTILESGAHELERKSVDIVELLMEVSQDADFEAGSRNCRVSLALGCSYGMVLQGSREFLRRAFENVIRNAVRNTEKNTEVEISCVKLRKDDSWYVVITVRDHGPGVPDWSLEFLFDPFFRVAESRDRQSGGAGLGLAIAERAVRMHEGSITAANDEEKGLIVTISLPLSKNT
ncbi:MAG: HAMP domain-containing protein [Deltaproteobacteria bacterium]|nr:HAMP domain-containing protein [Deltaproteobacteria bacterium]